MPTKNLSASPRPLWKSWNRQDCREQVGTFSDRQQFKSQHAEEAAVTDDVAGKAYVEQFGLDTFARADNAIRTNKASPQTIDTFQASATFLDLLQIWGSVEPDITSKVKFAKYHAVRIARAIKAGEDPNLSNPAPEPTLEEQLPPLDPNDADVQMLEAGSKPRQPSVVEVPDEADKIQQNLARTSSLDQSLHPSRDTSMPPPPDRLERQPSVTEVPDETDRLQRRMAQQSSIDQSLHPSRDPSLPRPPQNDVSPLQDATSFYTNQNGRPDISPLDSPGERISSIGGNYFPQVPSPTAMTPDQVQAAPTLPSAPLDQTSDMGLPSAPSEPSLPAPPSSFTQQPAPPPPAPARHHGHFLPQPGDPAQTGAIPPNFTPQAAPRQQQPVAPSQHRLSHGRIPPVPSARGSVSSLSHQQSPVTAPVFAPQTATVGVDEEKMMSAQKHSRWAISALNFEDVPTAIRELRAALADLGG
jgi:vacuolar protein sorting-associated protein VTA1